MKTKLLNLGWLSIEEGLRLAVGLVFTVIVARKLGPEGFGAYAYVISFVTILGPLARFGLEAHVMRVAATNEIAVDGIWSSLAAATIMTAVAATLTVLAFLASDSPASVSLSLMILALPILLTAPFDLIAAFLKGRERMKALALPRMIATIIYVLLSTWVFFTAPDISNFVMLRSVESGLLAAAALAGFVYIGGAPFDPIRLYVVGRLLVLSLPLMISVVSTMIFLRVDQVFLGLLSSETELGRYAVAAKIVEIGNIVPALLQAIVFAAMVRNFQSGPSELDFQMQSVFDAFALAGWGAAIAFAITAYLLLVPVFGSAYAEAMPMILILLAGVPFYFLFYAFGTELIARGRYWTAALTTSVGALANIVLNVIMIPTMGGRGAATASVASYLLAGIGTASLVSDLRSSAWKMILALNPFSASSRLLAQHFRK